LGKEKKIEAYNFRKNLIFIIIYLDTMNLIQSLTLLLIFMALFIQDVLGKAAKKVVKAPPKKPVKPAPKKKASKKKVVEEEED
jgi:hypothetical protein